MEVYFNRSLIVCHKILIVKREFKISKDNKAERKFSPDTNSLDSRNELISTFKFSFIGQLLEIILINSAYLVHLRSNRFLKNYSLRFFSARKKDDLQNLPWIFYFSVFPTNKNFCAKRANDECL